MKKLIQRFAIIVAVLALAVCNSPLVAAKTLEEARSECTSQGGRFNVSYYTAYDGGNATCSLNGTTNYITIDAETSRNNNNDQNNQNNQNNQGDSGGTSSGPVYQTPTNSPTSEKAAILTNCANAEDDAGGGIRCVVLTVVNIMTVLVGIVGVIGIVIVGLQYLTAGGNEEQTRKAKRRLFEIVIGIIAFVLVNALLNWLLPNFNAAKSALPSVIAALGA